MSTIRIFIASSSELKEDRRKFREFLSVENDRLNRNNKGIYYELVQWEHFLDHVSDTRLQDEYNKALKESSIVICLFFTKAGKYTQEEFDVALQHFKQKGKPIIYTYFKSGSPEQHSDDEESQHLTKFKKYLADIGHFYSVYNNTDELQNMFKEQLDRLEDKGFIVMRDEFMEIARKFYRETKRSNFLKNFLMIFVPVLGISGAYWLYQYQTLKTPLSLTVNLKNLSINPELPEPKGKLVLTFGDKTDIQDAGQTETMFKGIPATFKKHPVKLSFTAAGFEPKDTEFLIDRSSMILPVIRNNDLGKIIGVIHDEQDRPLKDVKVSVLDLTAYTDSSGHFLISIPFEKQRLKQRLDAFKEGYRKKDVETPVIPHEMVRLILQK